MLIDQLKGIYVAGELDLVETANWNPKVTRRDYMVGLENTGSDKRKTRRHEAGRIVAEVNNGSLRRCGTDGLQTLRWREMDSNF